ncbi:MAG TPA: hypothetical protein VMA86_01345 [Acetobacteraceae bacterium]|nr:hypothetical protein [Acetobacteraceae bacterium]
MTLASWLIILALMAGFGCDVAALYRVRRDNTLLARMLLVFSLLTLAVLLVYAYAFNPYPQKPAVTYGFLGAAMVLFAAGVLFAKFAPSGAAQRLSPQAVRALLPESIIELTPEEIRAIVPASLRKHADHELRMMMLAYLSRSPPGTIRNLTPERLRALLRREIPRSILDSQ